MNNDASRLKVTPPDGKNRSLGRQFFQVAILVCCCGLLPDRCAFRDHVFPVLVSVVRRSIFQTCRSVVAWSGCRVKCSEASCLRPKAVEQLAQGVLARRAFPMTSSLIRKQCPVGCFRYLVTDDYFAYGTG